ncbi:hypothetical protein AB0J86_19645 [Micromonospora sp. NPDC049559]|uniref:hypothetical protein n=1 Tax=Micromonospora sp. NPDC049559 TaxID=3155923 RepID=UPI00344393BE
MNVRLVASGALAALVVPALVVGASPPLAAYAAASSSVSFNEPTVSRADDSLITQLTDLVDAAATGSTIRVSLPALTEQAVTDRLLAAQNGRQVTVQVVAEQCAIRDTTGACAAPSTALAALAGGITPGNFTWCVEGCLSGAGALDTAGFWIFDALGDGRQNVVVQTSADPTGRGRLAQHDLLLSAGDANLATGFRNYFAALRAGTPATFTGGVTSADGKTVAYFSPRAATEADPLAAPIDAAVCPGATIRVAAAAWTVDRAGIVNKLSAKKTAGCTVEVVIGDRNDAVPALGAAGIANHTYRPGGCHYPVGGDCDLGNLGTSFVLVSGSTAGTGTVVTGLRGLTDRQLHRDDAITVKSTDPVTYQAYGTRFDRLKEAALKVRVDDWPNATLGTGNSNASGDQDFSAVAANRNGHLAVVWEDDRDTAAPEDDIHSEVFLRLFKNGTSVYEKKLSAGGTGNWRHTQPDVALDDAGNAYVAWAIDGDGNGYNDINVTVVKPDGTVAGSAVANAATGGQQIHPSVAADPDGGGFAVAWEDVQSGASPTIRLARYASIGSKTFESQVSRTAASGGGQHRPDVGMSAAGNIAVGWEEDTDGNGYYNIALKVLTPSGGTKVAEFAANDDDAGQQRAASVAVNFNGDIAVAWEGDQTGKVRLYSRLFTPTGAAVSTDRLVTEDSPGVGDPVGAQSAPRIALDDQRNTVVAWTEVGYSGTDVWARGFNPDGTVAGRLPATRFNATTAQRQDQVALAVSAFGEVNVAYTDDADGNGFDQIILRLGFSNSVW